MTEKTRNRSVTTDGRAMRRWSLISVGLLGIVLVAAACGSSSPEAEKKPAAKAHVKDATKKPTTTSTTAAVAAAKATTTTTKPATPAVAPANAVTPATSPPPAGPPGGSLSASPTSTPAGTLTGVGASSIEPFYGRVFYQYNQLNKGLSINYSPAGSGPGVTAIQQNTANFGQSEIPMSATQLAAAQGPVVQVPVDLGGVAISYNEPCASGLHLTGAQIAQIYLRAASALTWNQLAPSCPADPIVPVFRSDTSGPGYDLDQYLIDTAGAAWTGPTGSSTASTTWPTAARGSGTSGQQLNTGVASYIQATKGAIGYVEYSYALAANFSNAALQNQAGAFVAPSIASIGAAGANAANLTASNFNIVYSGGADTYPLANFSWALLYLKQANLNIGIQLGKLFQWVVTTGQSYSNGLGYAQLPANAVALAHATLLSLQTSAGQPIFSP